MRIAYFTAGTTGAGHFVRGAAIERALRRAGFHGTYRMFGPPLRFPAATRDGYEAVEIRPAELLHGRARAEQTGLATALRDFRPDVLLVDLFWAPLRHILPLPGCEAWLLLRSCPPKWFVGTPASRFDPAQFQRILLIEPLPATPFAAERIAPVVIANPDECRPATALRERLAIAAAEELVAVVHAGREGEIAALADEAGAPGARRVVSFDLGLAGALFPIAEWLGGADRIVAGAGYNAYWEARWLGHAARTRFIPLPRSIDDQHWRVTHCADLPLRANGADVIARGLIR